MKPLTREWVDKAEADLRSAGRELRARNAPNLDAACFFAQQAMEKYLKARLQEASVPFRKIHDLETLLNQLAAVEPSWHILVPGLKPLSAYAVVFRYPGHSATKKEAQEAIRWAKKVRELARRALGLPSTAARRRAAPTRNRKDPSKKLTH
jgi:HEPN domain-containing protein